MKTKQRLNATQKGLALLAISWTLTTLIIASPTPVQVSTLVYSSFRNNSTTIGQEISLKIYDQITITTDFESYLSKYANGSFVPSMINYGLSIDYKNIGWKHNCLHDIDQYIPIAYPRKNEFYIRW